MYQTLSAPISVQVELTPWCSQRCVHCYNFWRESDAVFAPVLSTVDIAIQQRIAKELVRHKVFHATLTGGEPLGVIEQLADVLLALKASGVALSLNSNLVLLNEAKIALLKRLGIKSILTSLISADETLHNTLAQNPSSYQKTIAGIRLAVAAGFRVTINTVVTKQNLTGVVATGQLAKELGASVFSATKAAAPANCPDFSEYQISPEDLSQMLLALLEVRHRFGINVDSLEHYPACAFPNEEARRLFGSRNCSAAKTSCTLGFDGVVRPCSHAHLTYGNIEDGLDKSWEAMRIWRTGELVPAVCSQQCGEFPKRCGGGCRIEAAMQTGNLAGSDTFCRQSTPVAKFTARQLPDVQKDDRLQLRDVVMFREESFGHVAYAGQTNWLPIDQTLYEMLISSRNGGVLMVTSIMERFKTNESVASRTLSQLLASRIVSKI